MNRYRRWIPFLLALLIIGSGIPITAFTPLTITPSSVTLSTGDRLTSVSFLAKDDTTIVEGTFGWAADVPSGTPLTAGSYSYTVIFTPKDTTTYGPAVQQVVTVTVKGTGTTAEELQTAVNALSANPTRAEVDAVARQLCALDSREQRRLSESTLERLGKLYNTAYGLNLRESASVSNNGFSSSKKIPAYDSYTYGASAAAEVKTGASMRLYQEEPSGSALLQFETEPSAGTTLHAPVVLHLALPSGFSSNRDYIVRDQDGNKISADISASFAVFVAKAPAEYRILKVSGDHGDDSSDSGDYVVPAFWEDVIDSIAGAHSGDRVRVDIGRRTTVPADVLRELQGRSVTLSLRRSNGGLLTIYGRDVERVPSNRNEYTITTLENLYDGDDWENSIPSSPPIPTTPPIPVCPPAPVVPVAPVPVTPAPIIPAPVPPPASSTRAEHSMREEISEKEVPAIEDSSAEESSETESSAPESSKPTEPTGGKENTRGLAVFAAVIVAVAALVSGLLTVLLCRRRKK